MACTSYGTRFEQNVLWCIDLMQLAGVKCSFQQPRLTKQGSKNEASPQPTTDRQIQSTNSIIGFATLLATDNPHIKYASTFLAAAGIYPSQHKTSLAFAWPYIRQRSRKTNAECSPNFLLYKYWRALLHSRSLLMFHCQLWRSVLCSLLSLTWLTFNRWSFSHLNETSAKWISISVAKK